MGQSDQGLHTGKRRYQVIPRVLIFLRNGSDVLLLKGAPNKRIWANRYNGVGGHVEVDEDIYSAALREVKEETGLDVSRLNLKAVVNIDAGDNNVGILMFAFTGWSSNRQFAPSHEGELFWIPANSLPKEELVDDLNWLLPKILTSESDEQPIFLHYSYDLSDNLIIKPAIP